MSADVVLWRVAAETRDYEADDLSGTGPARYPGRWNAPGQHVVYAARSISLAYVETAAHVLAAGFPLNRFLVRLTVPPEVWAARSELTVGDLDALDPAWSAIPAGRASAEIGSRWYAAGREPLLVVPSVIVPEESVVIIHARHPQAGKVRARTIRRVTYEPLFRK